MSTTLQVDENKVFPLEPWRTLTDIRIEHIRGLIPPMQGFDALEVLAVTNNQIPLQEMYGILDAVSAQTALRYLDVANNCAVFQPAPFMVRAWPRNLLHLNLSGNNITFFNVTQLLCGAPLLKTLLCDDNALTELQLQVDTPPHAHLRTLSLDNNRFAHFPIAFYKSVLFPALEQLSLRYNQIVEVLNIRHYTHLQDLDLTCNKIQLDHSRIGEVLPLETLKRLSLAHNFVYGIAALPLTLDYVVGTQELREIVPHVFIGAHHRNYAVLQLYNITNVIQILQTPNVDTFFFKQLGISVHAMGCRAICSDFEAHIPAALEHCVAAYKQQHANLLVCCNGEQKFAVAFVCLLLLVLGDVATYVDAYKKVSALVRVVEDPDLQGCVDRSYQLHRQQQQLPWRCALF